MQVALHVAAFVLGAVTVGSVLASAIRTVVLPRGVSSTLSRGVFRIMRSVFTLMSGRHAPYPKVDRVMALYAPATLLVLVLVWETLVLGAYAAMYWGIGPASLPEALRLSGSSLLTLGTARAEGSVATFLMFSEAALGLLLLALLITFLPTIYTSFARREAMVALLEVRAGAPPTAVEMLFRFHRIHGLGGLDEVWPRWERWFAEVEESHTSYPALVFFRSPQPEHSWVTAAGAVLDGAAMRACALDLPRDPNADLCIRAGYLALRRIAAYFGISFDPDPSPTDPISITREEFDAACDRLASEDVPMKRDREQMWRDFNGWRVNYDEVLLGLAGLTLAPPTPWSSDRIEKRFRLSRTGGVPTPIPLREPR